MSNTNGDQSVTQSEFESTMTAIQATLNQMQEEIIRGRRVQETTLKTVQSIEGRLKETGDHEERITSLENKVFALETKSSS